MVVSIQPVKDPHNANRNIAPCGKVSSPHTFSLVPSWNYDGVPAAGVGVYGRRWSRRAQQAEDHPWAAVWRNVVRRQRHYAMTPTNLSRDHYIAGDTANAAARNEHTLTSSQA